MAPQRGHFTSMPSTIAVGRALNNMRLQEPQRTASAELRRRVDSIDDSHETAPAPIGVAGRPDTAGQIVRGATTRLRALARPGPRRPGGQDGGQ